MNSRERVQRAIHFQQPDRVPIAHGVLPAAWFQYGEPLAELLETYADDFGWSQMAKPTPQDDLGKYTHGDYRDPFGTVWRSEAAGISGIPVEFPLAAWGAYESYQWPELPVTSPPVCLHSAHLEHQDGNGGGWYARGGVIKFFEQLQQLRGMEAALMDVALETPEFRRLVDDLLAFNLRWIERFLRRDYDGIVFSDDWGAQHSLLINPATWRRIFKPVYAAMFAPIKAHGWNIHLHSDGMILDIIPDLIELGVDVLNCQAPVIGLNKLRPFAGKLCFRTDLDRQRVLPFGTPSQVQEHVQAVFEALGTDDGGLIAFGEVSPDVPLENVQAMVAAFATYGHYHRQ